MFWFFRHVAQKMLLLSWDRSGWTACDESVAKLRASGGISVTGGSVMSPF
jgi:hypothetical protein